MRVRALVSFASPAATAAAGDVFTVSDAQAVEWIRVGLVARVEQSVETAMRTIPETTVTRKGKR